MVRQAIRQAINIPELLDKTFQGHGTLATSFIPAVYPQWQWKDDSKLAKYDPTAANAALDAAGYAKGANGIRNGKDGKPINLRLFVDNADSVDQSRADFIVPWLKAIGIGVKVEPTDGDTISADTTAGKYDMYFTAWSLGADPDYQLGINTCASLPTKTNGEGATSMDYWCDPEFDKLFAQQHAELDQAKRQEIVKQMQAIHYDAAPSIDFWYPESLEAFRSDKFTGLTKMPEDGGVLTGQSGYWALLDAKPVSAASGDDRRWRPRHGWLDRPRRPGRRRPRWRRPARPPSRRHRRRPRVTGALVEQDVAAADTDRDVRAGTSLWRYAARKVGGACLSLAMVVILGFFAFRILPGDPTRSMTRGRIVTAGAAARRCAASSGSTSRCSPSSAIYLRDLPRGRLGESYTYRRPVSELIAEHIGATLLLTGVSAAIAIGLGPVDRAAVGLAARHLVRPAQHRDRARALVGPDVLARPDPAARLRGHAPVAAHRWSQDRGHDRDRAAAGRGTWPATWSCRSSPWSPSPTPSTSWSCGPPCSRRCTPTTS